MGQALSPTKKSKRSSRIAAWIIFPLFGIFMLALIFGVWTIIQYPNTPVSKKGIDSVKIFIPPGSSLTKITELLEKEQLILHPVWFRLYAQEIIAGQVIRSGHYKIPTQVTPKQIIHILLKNTSYEQVDVMINENHNLLDVAYILDAQSICKKEESLSLMRDPTFLNELNIQADSLEGYLYPDTYTFSKGIKCKKVIEYLVNKAKKQLDKVIQAYPQQWKKIQNLKLYGIQKFTPHELVILASLIEKETANSSERKLIGAVFMNRLVSNHFPSHRLETDPTIKYGCLVPIKKSIPCQKFEQRILKIHLEDKENQYNTYTHAGLPPGPIANPGRAAMEAVLLAVDISTPFLYFVSKNNGTHQFSSTYQEHDHWVDVYQRNKATPSISK